MNRVLDNCGCDPIYPSEFVKNIGSGIPGHGELEARAHLYNKLGLKWKIDKDGKEFGRPALPRGFSQYDEPEIFGDKYFDGTGTSKVKV